MTLVLLFARVPVVGFYSLHIYYMPMIFYGKATKKNLNTLKEAFLIYDKLSGQVVSVEKKKKSFLVVTPAMLWLSP